MTENEDFFEDDEWVDTPNSETEETEVGKMEDVIRDEIARLARRELKAQIAPLERRMIEMKRYISKLRRAVDEVAAEKLQEEPAGSIRAELPDVTQKEILHADLDGKAIRALRLELGLTQTSLAVLLGVTPAAVQLWEQGRSQPRGRNKAALVAARKLGKKEVQELLAEKGIAPSKRRLSVKKQVRRKRKTSA